jgi:hypothetical protein
MLELNVQYADHQFVLDLKTVVEQSLDIFAQTLWIVDRILVVVFHNTVKVLYHSSLTLSSGRNNILLCCRFE